VTTDKWFLLGLTKEKEKRTRGEPAGMTKALRKIQREQR
jgi:hypothetical protein